MDQKFNDLLSFLSESLTPDQIVLSTLQASIAAEITSKRLDMQMNQKQFSEYMNVSQGMISRWESGETNFTIQTLVEIASKLNIPMQSPFVTKPTLKYHSNPNVISVSNWNSSSSYSHAEYTSSELKEM